MNLKIVAFHFFLSWRGALIVCGLLAVMSFHPTPALAVNEGPPATVSQETAGEGQTPHGEVLGEEELVEMEPVDVWAKLRRQSGTKVLSGEAIGKAPSITGTITDALRGQSNIQFDSSSRSGGQGGEIRPPRISIRGSRPYENNYTIGGIGTSNILNPSGLSSSSSIEEPTAAGQPQGEAQSFFFDRHLLGEVTIHTENISAEYGGFQGGVVDAKFRAPRTDRFHAELRYKHTRDNWAQKHYSPDWTEDDREKAERDGRFQPEFDRHEYSLVVDGPLTDNLGILASYGEKRSYIDKETFWGGTQEEKRVNKNFLGKLHLKETDDGFSGALNVAYAPYSHIAQHRTNRNSQYVIHQGGWLASLDLNKRWETVGQLKNTLGYQNTEVSRTSNSSTLYSWKKYSTSKELSDYATWGEDRTNLSASQSTEGAFGDYIMKQRTLSWKSVMDFDPILLGATSHAFKLGFEVEHIRASADRDEATAYSNSIFNTKLPFPDLPEQDGVLGTEQYAAMKSVTPSYNNKVTLRNYSLFAEETFRYGRFMFRPGIRYSYDSISKNNNYAPRFYAEYDVFNDEKLVLNAGWNRYYGGSLLSYALRESGGLRYYKRNKKTNYHWEYDRTTNITSYNLGKLKTPYSDELTGGFEVNIYDTHFKFLLTERKNRDQLRSKHMMIDGLNTNVFTNRGKTDYWGLDISIAREFDLDWAGIHFLELSASRSRLKSNSGHMDTAMTDQETSGANYTISNDYVYYNGKKISSSDLPASNYNRPWVITLNHSMSLFDDSLRIFNLLRYEAGYDGIKSDGNQRDPLDESIRYKRYRTKRQPDMVTYDMAAEWDVIKKNDHALTLNFEMTNVFNKKNHSDTNPTSNYGSDYDMGRQIYAGFTLTW